MRCSPIAQRIALQEYLTEREPVIMKDIEDWLADEEKLKTLDKKTVEDMLESWLEEFEMVQPDNFFRDHPTNDTDLICIV